MTNETDQPGMQMISDVNLPLFRQIAEQILERHHFDPEGVDLADRIYPDLNTNNIDAVIVWIIHEFPWLDQSADILLQLTQRFCEKVLGGAARPLLM